ncbi:tudor domain-containing protein 7 isoform X2 [Diachasma alloeum]|uniref:tudor domain-containing protein 7 isoform X2 n=1 Tax=Diachasma alloeum TaxID=454923 RepID=UPI000738294E|nr:tudor domain-containing protein 7 isoform X2 [Diachasma alloeum]
MEEVMSNLRACLQTTNGGVPLEHVNKDYRSLEGENIPYRRLGFATLEDFIAQVPRVRQYRKCGVVYVEVIPNEKTGHLAALISKQKTSKRKPSRLEMTSRRPTISGANQGRPRFNSQGGVPQFPRRSYQPQRPGAYPGGRSYPLRGSGPAEGGRSYPRSNGNAEIRNYGRPGGNSERPGGNSERPGGNSERSGGNSERPVTTYPPGPVIKPEPTVRIYPPRAVVKSEPPVTTYPARPVVKSEPTVTTYPGSPPRGEPIPVITSHQNYQNYQVNDDSSMPRCPQAFQNRNNNGGKVSPPQTPQGFNFNEDFRGNGFRDVPAGDVNANGYGSMTPQVAFGGNTRERTPPPRRVVRSLSERLKRPSPEPAPVENAAMASGLKNGEGSFGLSSPLTPPAEADDPRGELSALAMRLNLSEPEYKTLNVGKGGRIRLFSQVVVGKHKFSSYPCDAVNEVEAAKLAAGAAVGALLSLQGPPVELRVTEDRGLVMQRILGIVDGHPNGVFRDRLPGFYREMHGEVLPEDWVGLVEQCRELALEKGVENSVIVCRSLPEVQRMKTPPLSPKRERPLLKPPSETPIPLLLPSSTLWPVYVSHVSSTSDVWIRLLEDEYNEKFYEMSHQLNAHYSSITESAPSVVILNHYVTKVNDEVHRVRVEALDPLTGDAEIFFVDTGDNDVVDPSRLFPLDKKFLEVPPQAIRACLSSLEEIAVCDTTTEIAEKHLLGKTFYMQVLNRDYDELSHVVVGVFYDTNSETDVNVNEKISLELHHVMELSKPEAQVAVKGKLLEVFVSHIEQNGDVYLQVKNDGMAILTSMLNGLLEGVMEDEGLLSNAMVKGQLDPAEVYLAQKPDGDWVRVQVSPSAQDHSLRTIDSGERVEVDLGKVLRLKELSDPLARFPAQAIKVEMNNLGRTRFSERVGCRLRELAGPGDVILCKVVQEPVFGRAAVVELFKRSQPENLLISINNTLDLEPEIIKCGDGNNNVRRKRLERRGSKSSDDSLKGLKGPKIPGVGEFFNVRVTNLVPSPGNFVVQPFEEKPKLEAMMEALQEAYKTVDVPKETINELEKGRVYAVKNYDGYWYRYSANKRGLVSPNMLTIPKISREQELRIRHQAIRAR